MSVRRLVIALLGGVAAALVGSLALAGAAHADTNPSAPQYIVANSFANGSSTDVYLSWSPPTNNGGSALTYTVSNGTTTTPASSAASAQFLGLNSGTNYTFTVIAKNAANLTSQATLSYTTAAPPTVPTNVTATVSGTNANVSWTAPTWWGSGDSWQMYAITPRIAGVDQTNLTQYAFAPSATTTFSSLNATTTYTFVVTASSYFIEFDQWSGGTSAVSAPSAAFALSSPPSAATITSASFITEGSAARGDIFWDAPTSNGGSALTYTVTASPGGASSTTTSTATSIYGLTPGTNYTFTVKATNASGQYSTVTSSSVTAPVAAGAPTAITSTAGNTTASVSWTAPSASGSGTISGYYIYPKINGSTQWSLGQYVTGTTASFTGLTNGTTYTFDIRTVSTAANGWGYSAYANGGSVAPGTTPSAATITSASFITEGSAARGDIFWDAPTSNGGSALTYTVTASPGGASSTTTSTATSIYGLTPGTNYTFTVKATNASNLYSTVTSSSVTAPVAAGAPTAITATPGNNTASVSWTAPSASGSGTISGYYIYPKINGSTQWSLGQYVTGTTASFTGLTNGTTYTFNIRTVSTAANGWGYSAYANGGSVAPGTTPSAATITSASFITEGSAARGDIFWDAPTSNGGSALTYTVTASPGGASSTTTSTATSIYGLTPGTNYTFTVKATNASNLYSTVTSSSVTAPTPAGVPTGISSSAGDGTVNLSWTAPTSSGSGTIDGYYIYPKINGSTQWSLGRFVTSTSTTFTGLTNGTTYTFDIRTRTADPFGWGYSAYANGGSVAPGTTPTAATITSASFITEGSAARGDIFWDAPTSNGGSALTYTVTASPGGASSTTTNTATSIYGLTPGTNYTFTVKATNASNLYSTVTSSSVTAPTPAGVPTGISSSAGDGTVNLSWTAPTSSGSGTIDGYYIYPKINGSTQWSLGRFVTSTSTTFTGLTNGTTYTFDIRTRTADPFGWGYSAYANGGSVTPVP